MAGNLNSGRSYLITAVLGCAKNCDDIFETLTWIMLLLSEKSFYTQMKGIDFGFLRAYLARIQDWKLILKYNVKFATCTDECTHCAYSVGFKV